MPAPDAQAPSAPSPIRRIRQYLSSSEGGLVGRVFRSSLWVGFSHVGQTLLQFGRQIVLARLLTPDAFGTMNLCLVVTRGLDLFTTTGIGPALIHRQHDVDRAKNTALTLQAIRGVGLGVVTVLIAPLAAAYYDAPELTALIATLSLVFLLNGLVNVETILLNKRLEFRKLTALDLWSAVIGSIALVLFAIAFRSVWALVFGNVVTALTRLVLSYTIIRTGPVFAFDRQIAREFFTYGRFITGLTALQFIASEMDNVVVGKVLGFDQLGFYSIAFMLANLPATSIARTAMLVIFPAYSSLQSEPAKLREAYLTVLRVVGSISLSAAAGLAALAPDLIRVVYGEKWLPAAGPLRILALLGAARSISILSAYVYNAVGKPQISFYLVLGRTLVILPLLYPMTKHYGIEGTALTMAVPQFLELLAAFVALRYVMEVPLRSIAAIMGRLIVNVSLMVAVVLLLRLWLGDIGGPEVALLVAVGAATYAALSADQVLLLKRLLSR